MIELSWGVLPGQFIIAVEVTRFYLVPVGNGIVARHGILRLGAVGVGIGLLERESLQDEE